MSFKLGKFDKAKGINVTDKNAKLSDPKLRQALAYAIDVEGVNEKLGNGINTRATTLIPPAFASFHTKDMPGFTHDKKKAQQLLDEAGYKDVDGDGIREDKDGKPFTIKLGAQGGTEVLESTIEYYRQNWKEVGINVELASGRLMEFNSFSDKLKKMIQRLKCSLVLGVQEQIHLQKDYMVRVLYSTTHVLYHLN